MRVLAIPASGSAWESPPTFVTVGVSACLWVRDAMRLEQVSRRWLRAGRTCPGPVALDRHGPAVSGALADWARYRRPEHLARIHWWPAPMDGLHSLLCRTPRLAELELWGLFDSSILTAVQTKSHLRRLRLHADLQSSEPGLREVLRAVQPLALTQLTLSTSDDEEDQTTALPFPVGLAELDIALTCFTSSRVLVDLPASLTSLQLHSVDALEFLRPLQNLTTLSLNQFGRVEPLRSRFPPLPSLTEIHVAGLDDVALGSLGDGCAALVDVTVVSDAVTGRTVGCLDRCRSLARLSLCVRDEQGAYGQLDESSLVHALSSLPPLTALHLAPLSFAALPEVARAQPDLVELGMEVTTGTALATTAFLRDRAARGKQVREPRRSRERATFRPLGRSRTLARPLVFARSPNLS